MKLEKIVVFAIPIALVTTGIILYQIYHKEKEIVETRYNGGVLFI